jgi:lysyl-tRNA synthetase class 2
MEYSRESQDRMKKIADLKTAGVICYANNYVWKIDISEIRERSEDDNHGGYIRDIENLQAGGAMAEFQTAGRIISHKSHGKLTFAKIRDFSWDIQICFMRDLVRFNTGREIVESIEISGEEKTAYKIAEKFMQVADYIGVKGDLFETKHGELTLFVSEFQIMSKAVRPLPEKWHGLNDIEAIQRQRYLDMVMNDDTYEKFKKRSVFLKSIRKFLDDDGFMEIDCPVLDNAASGAAAQPFTTHHNALDIDVYLRICDEIPLKKATAWRFEKVYEMSKVFRNEGIDPSHLQEFTMLEFQAAYWTLEENMNFTEKFVKYLIGELWVNTKVPVKDKNWNEKLVDFWTDWQRVNYSEAVSEVSWIDISKYSEEDENELRTAIKAKWHEWEGLDGQATATMIDYLYKKVLRPNIVWPAFIYNYPRTMQPLARQSDENPMIVEQYQVVVNGWEIIKCYSELIDPSIQKANFEAQWDALERWDEEATAGDDDYLLAMEHWFPPQSGFGMGIERIFALLMQEENLREVVMFPMMRPLAADDTKKQKTQLAVSILNAWASLEKWQELNTVAHLSASFAARGGKKLFEMESTTTADGIALPMNIQHAIMIKQAKTNSDIQELYNIAKNWGLDVVPFTREMLETSDDKIVQKNTQSKNLEDVEYLGILIFGEKKHVEKLTKDLALYR